MVRACSRILCSHEKGVGTAWVEAELTGLSGFSQARKAQVPHSLWHRRQLISPKLRADRGYQAGSARREGRKVVVAGFDLI